MVDVLLAVGVEAGPDIFQRPGQVDDVIVGYIGLVFLAPERPDVVEARLRLQGHVVRGQLRDLLVDLPGDIAQVRLFTLLLEPVVPGPHDEAEVGEQRLRGRRKDELHAPVAAEKNGK